jgi:GNAT superfamily N-acetyltransferase
VPAAVFTDFTPAEDWIGSLEAQTLWVALVEGRPEAFLGASASGERLHIDEFAVAAEHQGKGLGRRMLAHCIEAARSRGFRLISLTTFRDVPWNAPFYASAGFEPWPDPPADIAEKLADERRRGLKNRLAMRLVLAGR